MIYNLFMKDVEYTFRYNSEKNATLIKERSIGFEDIIVALGEGLGLDVIEHPNSEKYGHQKIFVVDIDGYVYLVPFVEENDDCLFLKTIFPSRKMTEI